MTYTHVEPIWKCSGPSGGGEGRACHGSISIEIDGHQRVRLLGSQCTQDGPRTRHHCSKGGLPQSLLSVTYMCLLSRKRRLHLKVLLLFIATVL